ncbi:MAG: hypothetical protein WCV90_03735 [Candidatus Woesearchaeota archaeon]|jgi:hypothetical protein
MAIDNTLDGTLKDYARQIYHMQLSRLERLTNSLEAETEKSFALYWLHDGAWKPLGYQDISEILGLGEEETKRLQEKYPRPKEWEIKRYDSGFLPGTYLG